MQDVIDLTVIPLSGACGAEIKGVDITRPLAQETVQAIKQAWAKHLVLVFRGQTITQDQQLRFASYFGDLGNRKKALHIHEYKRSEKADISGDFSGIPHYYHPVFITHPQTGRKSLFVDRLMTARIEGVPAHESSAILDQLYEISERPEFIYEHVWKLGDFLMWDNRCTIHARTDFPKHERRLLRRCTVQGEPLFE